MTVLPDRRPVPVEDVTSAVAPSARRTHLRRRPTGAPPPLPRSLGRTGRGWIIAAVVVVVWLFVALVSAWARRLTDNVDAAVLRAIAAARTGWLTSVARTIDRAATGWVLSGVAMALLVATMVCKRWRHLFTYLGATVVLQVTGVLLIAAYQRPRPFDVTTIGRWQGFSLPSATVAIVSFTVVGVAYMLVVPGRPRTIAKAVGTVVVVAVVGSRLYLAVDHPFDVVSGVALGVAFPLVAFRFFTPNDVVPVTYGGGKKAHLDVGGRRGQALREAVEDQLGVTVVDVKPVGLAGSGGSTPLRLRLAGDPDTYVFGKLYAMNHVRADRWYKTGRTILYGRLEDEAPFQSVRRLVQYEDYALRVMRDAGVPTAAPLGIVELTPEREYLLVTEFFDGAVEIGDAEVDDQVIDEGLALVRRLWQAGLAHRDIKPANLLVKDGHLLVIDVAFAQVRPSPWREAIDLANMMLVLAVRTDAARVYERALAYFTPDEIAEAFAATRGIASPSQLRSILKRDGRDLVAEFRAMAPARRPISLQRWGPRRILMAAAIAALGVVAVGNVYAMHTPAELPIGDEPTCSTDDVMVLMAQAVPSAPAVPCMAALPAGWSLGGVTVRRGEGRFWLDSDRAGGHAVDVRLRGPGTCAIDGAAEVPSDEPSWRRYDERLGDHRSVRTYVADGACVQYRFDLDEEIDGSAAADLDAALGFQPRDTLVAAVAGRSGLVLCGAGS
jgi:tRNA A-37 threonylcarbamoyl transferase component Bud32/membrane-associated phospholipid phosphatase